MRMIRVGKVGGTSVWKGSRKCLAGIVFALIYMTASVALAQTPAIDSGVLWLGANQNPSGSWGDPELTEFRDSTFVAGVLKKLGRIGPEYNGVVSYIATIEPGNTDYLARKTAILARDGYDVSAMVDDLVALQNPEEFDNTVASYPEGGWGANEEEATNNLDTRRRRKRFIIHKKHLY